MHTFLMRQRKRLNAVKSVCIFSNFIPYFICLFFLAVNHDAVCLAEKQLDEYIENMRRRVQLQQQLSPETVGGALPSSTTMTAYNELSLILLHQQLLFERQQRLLHAERNRRLFGKKIIFYHFIDFY